MPVNVVVEGLTDEAVLKRILEYIGLTCGIVRGYQGKHYILERLSKYNQAARFAPWVVVVDLDQDAECAPEFIAQCLPTAASQMRFRVATRAIEAWLLADREHIAAFLGIAVENVPRSPDLEQDPKLTLVNLTRRSHKTSICQDIIPRQGSARTEGPGYASQIIKYVTSSPYGWRPEVAAQHSDSLQRCIRSLQRWAAEAM